MFPYFPLLKLFEIFIEWYHIIDNYLWMVTWLDSRIWTEINVLTSNLIWLSSDCWAKHYVCSPKILELHLIESYHSYILDNLPSFLNFYQHAFFYRFHDNQQIFYYQITKWETLNTKGHLPPVSANSLLLVSSNSK